MFHPGVGPWKHQRFATVVVPDQVGRFAVLPMYLHDFGGVRVRSHNPALDVQPVSHCYVHDSSSRYWTRHLKLATSRPPAKGLTHRHVQTRCAIVGTWQPTDTSTRTTTSWKSTTSAPCRMPRNTDCRSSAPKSSRRSKTPARTERPRADAWEPSLMTDARSV